MQSIRLYYPPRIQYENNTRDEHENENKGKNRLHTKARLTSCNIHHICRAMFHQQIQRVFTGGKFSIKKTGAVVENMQSTK